MRILVSVRSVESSLNSLFRQSFKVRSDIVRPEVGSGSQKLNDKKHVQRSVICKLDKYVYSDTNDTLVEEHKE